MAFDEESLKGLGVEEPQHKAPVGGSESHNGLEVSHLDGKSQDVSHC